MEFALYLAELMSRHPPGAGNVAVYRRVDSTNLVARRVAAKFAGDSWPPPRVWVLAYEQSYGRGRLGRSWMSPAGKGVYASLLLPLVRPEPLGVLPLAVALGLCEAIDPLVGGACTLKWPNDVLVDGLKIGGILIESVRRGGGPPTAIVGFGVNHGQTENELATGRATSLRLAAAAEPPSLAALTGALIRAVDTELDRAGDAAQTVARYVRRSTHRAGDSLRCHVGHETVEGIFAGFDGRGFLRLRTSAGERLISAGEVIGG